MSLFFALGIFLVAMADNIIEVSSVEGHPGDVVDVTVNLNNSESVSAIQMDFQLGDLLSFVKDSELLESSRKDDHKISATVSDGILRLMVYSLGLKDIVGTEGKLCKFSLKLAKEPADIQLSPSVVLTGSDGQKKNCTLKNGNVKILCPKISIVEDVVDFGSKAIRSTYNEQFTIVNVGTEDLHVTGISSDNSVFSFDKQDFTVSAGKQENITVSYLPTARTSYPGVVTVASNAINGEQNLNIKASAFSVNELHVQPASGLSDEEVEVTVRMNNMEAISAIQFSLDLPDGIDFVDGSVKSCRSELSAYSKKTSNTVDIMMYSLQLANIAESDADLVTFKVKLNCTSGSYLLEPKNVVLGNVNLENVFSLAEGQYVSVKSPKMACETTFDFGKCDITQDAFRDYTITNSGDKELVVSKIVSFDENLSVTTQLPLTLQAGETMSIGMKYHPDSLGDFSSVINIYTDDPTARMAEVTVAGEVYAPNTLTINGTVNETSKKGILNVSLDNYTDIVAIQAELHCNADITINTKYLMKGARMDGYSVSLVSLGDNNYRLVAYTTGNSAIKGNSGNVLSVPFTLSDNALLQGDVMTVDNVKLSDAEGQNCSSLTSASFVNDKWVWGDIDGDKNISISDITSFIAILNGTKTDENTMTSSTDRYLVDLYLHKEEYSTRTRVVFNNKASLDYETNCDASQFSPMSAVPVFYSLNSEGTNYSINERPFVTGCVDLGVKIYEAGTYSISADPAKTKTPCLLYDRNTQTFCDLSLSDYTFTSATGTFDKRFVLVSKYCNMDFNLDGNVDVNDIYSLSELLCGKYAVSYAF